MERVDQQRLDYILGDSYLRTEMFGLHLTRERITSTQYKITASNDAVRSLRLDSFSKTFLPTSLTSTIQTYSSPASYAANRVWFHNNQDYSRGRAGATNTMSVWGRGVNASASETVRPDHYHTVECWCVYKFALCVTIVIQLIGNSDLGYSGRAGYSDRNPCDGPPSVHK